MSVWVCPVHGQVPDEEVTAHPQAGWLGTHGHCSALIFRHDCYPLHNHDADGLPGLPGLRGHAA